MNLTTKLILARDQVKNVMKLIEGNQYQQHMFMHLNSVYYEIERQLGHVTPEKPHDNRNGGDMDAL